jgi:hypothetical protein
MPKLYRIVGLCLILFITALGAVAAPQPCSCQFCLHGNPDRACTLDGATTTCGDFLIVALCPARP